MPAWEVAWQEAYRWLCRQRRNAPANADVWHLRFHWQREGTALRQCVEQGRYRLSPMQAITNGAGEALAMWSAQDALVLKWVALRVAPYLPVHERCHHVKGYGCRHSLQQVDAALRQQNYRHVYRTDIRGYYRHIRKDQLAMLVCKWVADPVLCGLILQFIDYSVEDGGEFYTPQQGISRGCALSPLLGASLLHHVDAHFAANTEVFYVRYMDDFLLLSPRRWPLRRAIRQLHDFLQPGGFELHPDKTQLGRLEKGFDWLGLWFGPEGTTIAPRALNNHRERCLRLYEQARRRGLSESAANERVRAYQARWEQWANSLQAARAIVTIRNQPCEPSYYSY